MVVVVEGKASVPTTVDVDEASGTGYNRHICGAEAHECNDCNPTSDSVELVLFEGTVFCCPSATGSCSVHADDQEAEEVS